MPARKAARSGIVRDVERATEGDDEAARRAGVLAALATLVLIASAGPAHAAEVHTLFDDACAKTSGVLVEVTEDRVSLVDLGGQLVTWPRARVASIALHKTLENPLARIDTGGALAPYLRDVWVGDDRDATFTGWTTAFFDDLFIYYDLDGQTHVLDPEEIRRIRPSAPGRGVVTPRQHAQVTLAFPVEIVPCGAAGPPPTDAVLPSRVIADRIKVGDYLGKLSERYLAQAGFEERTYVYATPFLFDAQNRLGLLYDPAWAAPFPLYFRWSGGRPYRFQSLSVVGNAPHEWLPFAFASLSVRSDVKSHFFSGTFVGHVLGLPAGTNPYLEEADAVVVRPGEAPRVDHSYNYLLLVGADYWRLSAAVGVSYLTTRLGVAGLPARTMLATSASPTVRLRYQGPDLQLRALYYRTRTDGPLGEVLDPSGEIDTPAQRYDWALDTVRVGATARPWSTVELAADQIVSRGRYADNAMPSLTPSLALDLLESTTVLEVAISFGRYVTVRGIGRVLVRKTSVDGGGDDTTIDRQFGGALEFVF